MKKIRIRAMGGLVVFGAFLGLLPLVGAVDCDKNPPGALQQAIDAASPGAAILVSGTCNENVTVPEGKDLITLDGGGKATLNGPDATRATLVVRGRGVTVKGFTITGGLDGISVQRGGQGTIDGNTIQGTGRFGIGVAQMGFAVIVNNTIQNNPNVGIAVAGNSFALIGFLGTVDETEASPNLIQKNGAHGINVFRSAAARIVGNDISNNTLNGVLVQRGSQADISDNQIDGNGQHGIGVVGGSGVNLGEDTGDTILTRPNSTTTNNGGFGVRCEVGGYTDGRLGSLNGDDGAESYSEGCTGSLIPPK